MQNTQVGNVVLYETEARKTREFSRLRVFLAVAAVMCLAVAIAFVTGATHGHGVVVTALLSLVGLFGVNTVTYEAPVAGTTAPTAAQARTHQSLQCTVNGDNSATTIVVTHNWGLSAADLAAGYPFVDTEILLASGNTAAALVTTKAANSVTLTVTAFTGVGLRIRLQRPFTQIR